MIAYKRLWPGKIVQFPCKDSFAGETAVMAMRIGLTQPDSYIYLPLHNLNTDYLDALFGQLLHPFLLLGDLNGRHHLWGNTSCNPRGRILDSSFSRDVVFFWIVTHSHTFRFKLGHSVSGSLGAQLEFTWRVMEDLHGSDHFPMLLESVNGIPAHGVKRWRQL